MNPENPLPPTTAETAANPRTSAVQREELLELIEGVLPPVRKSPLYFAGVSIVAVAMVILPVLYLGLILSAGYGVYLHATKGTVLLTADVDGRIRLFAYLAPLVVGAVVVVFMIKPLFARPPKRPEPFSLEPDKQTALFEYVRRLSVLTRSPSPRRIDIDCNVNASASFRRGWRSLFGNDLVLTIGLPLVEGMTLRQITGVLAHELGHFSQGGAMRLTYVIRSVSFWFARLVYERDAFDVALRNAAEGEGPWFWQLVLAAARGAVWLTRRVLWVFMAVGQVISSFLLRQMEYDADRQEARVAGSSEFEKTVYRLTMLSIGQQMSSADLSHFWEDRKLPEKISELVAVNAGVIPEEARRNAWDEARARRTRRFDTHPSESDRIRNALGEKAPGLVTSELPARILFDDYAAISRSATINLYRNTFGVESGEYVLIPTVALLAARTEFADSHAALARLYQGLFRVAEPVFPRQHPDLSHPALLVEIETVRRQITAPREKDAGAWHELVQRRFDLALDAVRAVTTGESEERTADIDAERVRQRIGFLQELGPHFGKVLRLAYEHRRLIQLLQQYETRKREEAFGKEVREATANCWGILSILKKDTHPMRYPYSADEDRTCESIAFEGLLPPVDEIMAVAQTAARCSDTLIRLYVRVFAELAMAAEKAETALGFPPLPAPSPPTPSSGEDARPMGQAVAPHEDQPTGS